MSSTSSTNGHSVEKIGGTSIADTERALANVLIGNRQGADRYRRIFVVSAYAGMTDLLLDHKKTGAPGVYARFVADEADARWEDGMTALADRMRARNAEMFDGDERASADRFIEARLAAMNACLADLDRLRGYGHFQLSESFATIREMLAGLGEAHSAFNTALKLRSLGVNAVFVDLTGWQETEPGSLDGRIVQAFADIDLARDLPIVTGYARCKGGMISRYARGYSEFTFSRIAVLTGAREAIIHKEFHLSSADPRLVGADRARKIGHTNYDVADQLANLGMEAVHPMAGRGLRQAGIPLRVRNMFDPADAGTLIKDDYVSEQPRVEIVTGVRNIFALQLFAQDMVGEKGYDATILDVLTRHRAWIVSKCSNANTITHYLSTSATVIRSVMAELEARYPAAALSSRSMALVAAIGSDINEPGVVVRALNALAAAGIEVIALQHQMRNVDVQFIVEQDRFDDAVIALHDALIRKAGAAAGNEGSALAQAA